MHTLVKMPSALAVLAFAILRAQAANVINELSFGLHHEVSKDGRSVPGWRLGGHDRRTPEVYSDRITLTPPYPGNLRTSLWTERTVQTAEWTADVEFRASGPERGSGNLQIWYAKDGEKEVGSASMYTIGQFDGLVLVVDQYGGHGGSIRGFLNDGTKSFKDHHQVDTLAFGHCDFAYRNLGHFTHLSMRQSRDEFSVEVEGHPCFKTHKVKMPSGYSFGISAASAENPDSFELSQFIVEDGTTGAGHSHPSGDKQQPLMGSPPDFSRHQAQRDGYRYEDESPDTPASDYRTSDEQFKDLHNRLMILHHQINSLVHDFEGLKIHTEDQSRQIIRQHLEPMHEFMDELREQMLHVEEDVGVMRKEFDSKVYKEAIWALHDAFADSHQSILHHIPEHFSHPPPRFGFLVFIFCSFQSLIVASYVVYKRRKNSGPKKFL